MLDFRIRSFYEETIKDIPRARFFAAGGYHNHVGLNNLNSLGGPMPPPDAVGLRFFTICLPDDEEVLRLIRRLEGKHIPFERKPFSNTFCLHDLEGNNLLVAVGSLQSNDIPSF
jgi:catechol 2,3-dioxygenase